MNAERGAALDIRSARNHKMPETPKDGDALVVKTCGGCASEFLLYRNMYDAPPKQAKCLNCNPNTDRVGDAPSGVVREHVALEEAQTVSDWFDQYRAQAHATQVYDLEGEK